MTLRKLNYQVTIDATKTRCGNCHFQHSEWSGCILFGGELTRKQVKVDPRFETDLDCRVMSDGTILANMRSEECKRAEKGNQ